MEFTETSLGDFAAALASKDAVPGGGGASALAGALAAALGGMVGSLTVGKRTYAAVEDEVRALMERAAEVRESLLAGIERDAQAFEPLSRAYGIPKDDPTRAEVLEACLHDAAAAPLSIAEDCCRAIELLEGFAEKGSVLAVSDAATGAALACGALRGAAVNVRVNTGLMADRAHAEALDARVAELMEEYEARADAVYAGVWERLAYRG